MKVLFLVPYPTGFAPSQRFRFEQYYTLLNERNITYKISSFIDLSTWNILYKPGNNLKKIYGILKGYFRRIGDIFASAEYDYIFIHRELTPLGPPVLEWMLAKALRKKIIYDFDDAIWIPNSSEHNGLVNYLKRYSNAKTLSRWAYKVSCGNEYLCNFARIFNKNVVLNPTVIDLNFYKNGIARVSNEKFVIGWTGSHSTIFYLDELAPVLADLEKNYQFEFHVISDKPPSFSLGSMIFKPWNKKTEIEDLLQLDAGLMPLTNDLWAQGKCGFKALQYMALGIPPLVSPVGVNSIIVDHDINGFLCRTLQDWKTYLIKVMTDKELLKRISSETRKKIEQHYSLKSNKENFLNLFS